jgi:hypothetical protein
MRTRITGARLRSWERVDDERAAPGLIVTWNRCNARDFGAILTALLSCDVTRRASLRYGTNVKDDRRPQIDAGQTVRARRKQDTARRLRRSNGVGLHFSKPSHLHVPHPFDQRCVPLVLSRMHVQTHDVTERVLGLTVYYRMNAPIFRAAEPPDATGGGWWQIARAEPPTKNTLVLRAFSRWWRMVAVVFKRNSIET